MSAFGSGRMFDAIARRYDLVNTLTAAGLDRRWRRRMVRSLGLSPGEALVDVATGTAEVALLAARLVPGLRVVGLDPSARMLAEGARKAARRGVPLALVGGDALALPFPDRSFDGASIAFGIRNVPDRPRALAELRRVLKPGGRLAVLELATPRGRLLGRAARAHLHRVVPRLGAWLSDAPAYDYLVRSIDGFPAHEEFVGLIASAGFERAQASPLTFGACVLFTATAPA